MCVHAAAYVFTFSMHERVYGVVYLYCTSCMHIFVVALLHKATLYTSMYINVELKIRRLYYM